MKLWKLMGAGAALALAAPLAAQDSEPNAPEFQDEMAEAQEQLRAELEAEFSMFSEFFVAEPLTEEQQARVPTAERMMEFVFPQGSFGIVMEESIGPLFDGIMGAIAGDKRTSLMSATGLDEDRIAALSDEEVEAALAIFDPDHDARNERLGEVLVKMMGEMFNAIEPAYRRGLTNAFATRFTEAEMLELIEFFETPTGGKFANNSILVQYDPQLMAVMEQMGPAIAEMLPAMMEEFSALGEEFSDGRQFGELSAAERARVAELLGSSESELESLQPTDWGETDDLEEETST